MAPSTAPTTCVTANTGTSTQEDDDAVALLTTNVPPSSVSSTTATTTAAASVSVEQQWEERVLIARRHFERKGYRVHSGLQFGCELVLYADDPSKVHSDFCIHVVPADGSIDWRSMQTLVRSMPDLHKTLILAFPRRQTTDNIQGHVPPHGRSLDRNNNDDDDDDERTTWVVDELALATEHAPFRHRKSASVAAATTTASGTVLPQVGTQYKKRHKTIRHENDR